MKTLSKKIITTSLATAFTLTSACTTSRVAEQREPSGVLDTAIATQANFFDENTINSTEVSYKKYDLNNSSDLTQLENGLQAFLREYKNRKASNLPDKEQYVVSKETVQPYNAFDFTDGSLKDAAEFILEQIARIKVNDKPAEAKYQIAQVARAIQLKYTPPLKTKFEVLASPIYLVRFLANPSVTLEYKNDDPELGFLREQVVSDQQDVSKIDFVDAFRFKEIKESCQYHKAKRGHGVHAGFQIKCGDTVYKMKFGNERYSGPFNTRVYRSLGYITPHINYAENITVDYDRKLLLEFNDRLAKYMKVTFVAIPVAKFEYKKFLNPFTFIKGFRMKNGSFVDVASAQQQLLTRPVDEVISDDMFNASFESQISQFVFGPSSLTLKDDKVAGEDIGPWMPVDLNYRDLKEVRGLMVLAAWTGNFDMRKDNLSLNLVKGANGKKGLRLTFGDAGSGLGKASGAFKSGSDIDDMPWEVSAVYTNNNNGEYHGPEEEEERISLGIGNLEASKVFSRIKISDAQWMLGKICQFAPQQILEALISSGLSSAEALLAQSKLLERRNKMIEHFKMNESFKQACYVPVNRKLYYDPKRNGLISTRYSNKAGKAITAPDRGHTLVKGKLVTPEDK